MTMYVSDHARCGQLRRLFDIVRLLAQERLSFRQLADRVGCSERTVRRHLYIPQGAGVTVTDINAPEEDDDWPIAARGGRRVFALDRDSWAGMLHLPTA
jgi:AraC-like DNA-binding protein